MAPMRSDSASTSTISVKSSPQAPPAVRKPYAKVDRSARACQRCHARKTRCSGSMPCKFCEGRGLECVFEDPPVLPGSVGIATSQNKSSRPIVSSSEHSGEALRPAPTLGFPRNGKHSAIDTELPNHLDVGDLTNGHQYHQALPQNYTNVASDDFLDYGRPIARLPSLNSHDTYQHAPQIDPAQIFRLPLASTSTTNGLLPPLPSNHQNTRLPPAHKYVPPPIISAPQPAASIPVPAASRPKPVPPPFNRPPSILQTVSQTSPAVTSPSSAGRDGTAQPPQQENDHSVSGLVLTRFQRIPTATVVEPDIPKMIERRASLRYFDAYFAEAEWIYQLWPFPDMAMSRYEAIWAEEEQYQAGKPKQTNTSAARDLPLGARTTICALLAFGALFERKYEDSERLYQAARQCYLDIAELMTLESVQLAMQMAVFEINTNRSRILWSTLAVATRVAHALNLHRKPALANKSPEESLRRTQLWWCTRVHDVWHSSSTGRPSLTSEADIDLDPPFDAMRNGQPRQVVSDIFAMRVRLSAIWTKIHDALYQRHHVGKSDHWLATLPLLENQFQIWCADMHEYVTPPEGAGAKRADKMQFQGVLLAYHIIRIIMHRSFLIQREIQEPSEAYRYQRGISEAAILDSAMQILDFCRRLIRLGVHLSFWFITSHIQISCLALCEYIQNYVERGLLGSSDLAQPQQGLETAVALLEEIEQSGENPAVVQVLEAVRTIQDAVRPALAHPQYAEQSIATTLPASLPPGGAMSLEHLAPSNQNITFASDINIDPVQAMADMDWLLNLTSSNIMDGFIASPTPAAENLAWWLNPYS